MKKRISNFSLFVFLILSFNAKSKTATFNITYNGFTPQAQTAFQYAADIWADIVVSSVPIKVNAYFGPLVPGLLGITFPNGEKNFTGAPHANTWYASSLANAIAGKELNPGEMDIDLYLNSSINWYYGVSGTVPVTDYDLVTVALHELGHGLGILSLSKKTNTTGSFGLLQASDFSPLTTSFPWPNLDTLPSVFDRLLVNNSGQQLDSFINPGTALGTALTSQNIFFKGANAMAANSGIRPKIYAPSTFELGSSISHFDEATYPAGNANELMTPNGTPGSANHNPGPIMLGALKDIGWKLFSSTGIAESGSNKVIGLYPNPAHNLISIKNLPENSSRPDIEIYDIFGNCILIAKDLSQDNFIDVSVLKSGCYIIKIKTDTYFVQTSFVKI